MTVCQRIDFNLTQTFGKGVLSKGIKGPFRFRRLLRAMLQIRKPKHRESAAFAQGYIALDS